MLEPPEPVAAPTRHADNRSHENPRTRAQGQDHYNRGVHQGYQNRATQLAHNDAVASGLEKAPRKRDYEHHVPANGARRGMKKGGYGQGNWGDNKTANKVVKDEEAAQEAVAKGVGVA